MYIINGDMLFWFLYIVVSITRKVWRYQRGNQNRRRTDNTMPKGKDEEGYTTIYNTYIMYIKLNIYNHIVILDLQVLLSTNKHFEKI
jgi:hypothetical protein